MDTQQLRDVLKRDLGPVFGGVYPRDVIPELLPHHKAIVVNTDPHDRPGAHWVCLYLSSPTVEYFDSYGLPPTHKDIQDFIQRHGETWTHNTHCYQDLNTDVCGQYCVYFLHQRHRHRSTVQEWLLPWKGTALQRDPFVADWFKETFRKPRTHQGQTCQCERLNAL